MDNRQEGLACRRSESGRPVMETAISTATIWCLLFAGPCAKCLTFIGPFISHIGHKIGILVVPILLCFRRNWSSESYGIVPGHTAQKWQNWDLNPILSDSKTVSLSKIFIKFAEVTLENNII